MTPLFKRSSAFGPHFIFFLVLAALLLFFDHRGSWITREIRVFLSFPLDVLRIVVDTPVEWSERLKENLTSHENLIKENEQLRQKDALLLTHIQKWTLLKQENARLHALLKTASQIDGKVSGANILSFNVQSSNQTLLLDKGRSEGVFIGQPVLDAYGLIGQVIRVDWFSCTVLLLTDLKSAIPVEVARTGEQGILAGTGSVDSLKLNNLSKTSHVKKRDILLTSGLGGHFPAGYPVGIVSTVQRVATDMFAQIVVSPMSPIDVNRPIFLLWPSPKPRSFIASIPPIPS